MDERAGAAVVADNFDNGPPFPSWLAGCVRACGPMAEDTAPLNYLNFPIPSLNVLPLLIIEEDTDNKSIKVI